MSDTGDGGRLEQAPRRHARLIFVVGMHRSGTSAVARGLQTAGVSFGNDLLPPAPDNPKGFYEDRHVLDLHERLLDHLNLKWYSLASVPEHALLGSISQSFRREAALLVERKLSSSSLAGIKDPRLCLFHPLWQSALRDQNSDVSYVLVVRHPFSIAESLAKRNQIERVYTMALWLAHMAPLLEAQRRFGQSVVTDYDLLMDNPRHELERIRRALHLPAPPEADVSIFADIFLDRRLRHHARPRDEDLRDSAAQNLWDALRRAATA